MNKNIIPEIKNSIVWINNTLDKAAGRISELEKTLEELIQNEAQRDQDMENKKRLKGIESTVRISNIIQLQF